MSKKCVAIRCIVIGVFAVVVSQILHCLYVNIDISGMPMTTRGVKIITGIYFLPVICIVASSGLLVLMDWLCNNFFKTKFYKQ